MNTTFLIFYILFLISFFFFNMFSFLNSLLILEFLSLFLFFLLSIYILCFLSLKMILFYFVFIVSESAIGLCILVKSLKYYGTNNFSSLNLSLF